MVARTRAEWLAEGIEAGWCSEVFCGSHDTTPLSEVELEMWEEGDDPCSALVRVDGHWNNVERNS